MTRQTIILGAGVSGLGAGYASGYPIYEAKAEPGGLCSSYYMHPSGSQRLDSVPADAEVYRFEIGGGHWLWGGDPLVLSLIRQLTPLRSYQRRAGVFLPDDNQRNQIVPYPLQYHLHALGPQLARLALDEIVQAASAQIRHTRQTPGTETLADWIRLHFGSVLGKLFFEPFHQLYTAGLWTRIAPPDGNKSPLEPALAVRGATEAVPAAGYNSTFLYPQHGLGALVRRLADGCQIHYGRRAVRIDVKDVKQRCVVFSDGSCVAYDTLIASLPLNRLMELTGLETQAAPDPYTSVLVLNVGATRGEHCPDEHWLYMPRSRPGFHRVGFYSNVDQDFLPRSVRRTGRYVSAYVEKSYPGGQRPSRDEINIVSQSMIAELQAWGWIGTVEVVDPTWIDVAYTWSVPGSVWREQAMRQLEAHGIHPVGRYARWSVTAQDQSIAASLRDGLVTGATLRAMEEHGHFLGHPSYSAAA